MMASSGDQLLNWSSKKNQADPLCRV